MNVETTTQTTKSKPKTEKRSVMQVRTGLRAGTWLLTTAGQ